MGHRSQLEPEHLGGRHPRSGPLDHLQFFNHFHPYVDAFVKSLNRDGVPGLLATSNQKFQDQTNKGTLFDALYAPNQQNEPEYPREIVDFDSQGAYSLYNWELFFHALPC